MQEGYTLKNGTKKNGAQKETVKPKLFYLTEPDVIV